MFQIENGSLRIFRFLGITVWVHWSWVVVGYILLQVRGNAYSTQAWNIAEYLSLFAIVLLHEYGHALACRSVGGRAERILLWPLGGVAYVAPPPRAGAVLWSLAAGPLVNVLLLAPTIFLAAWGKGASPDLERFTYMLAAINVVLLLFNLLPIYPLDGGQILRALLWFLIGPIKSLMASTVVGLIGASLLIAWALWEREPWLTLLAAFAAYESWRGFQAARWMAAQQREREKEPIVHS
jgi:Zn-dependent protease